MKRTVADSIRRGVVRGVQLDIIRRIRIGVIRGLRTNAGDLREVRGYSPADPIASKAYYRTLNADVRRRMAGDTPSKGWRN